MKSEITLFSRYMFGHYGLIYKKKFNLYIIVKILWIFIVYVEEYRDILDKDFLLIY